MSEKGSSSDLQPLPQHEKNAQENATQDVKKGETINPENEIMGTKLLLLHTGLCLCTFLVGLDFNLIATAVPTITSEFNSIGDVGWYGSAFYIALCASQPLAGKAFTLFPQTFIYLLYVALFEVGSLVCALAPSSGALIVGRAIAGLGASGIFAGGLVILTTVIPLHKRAIWTGTMNSTFIIASIVGPVLGGALTQHVTWRWCFYINLPIGGFSALVVFLFCRIKHTISESSSIFQKLRKMDGIGFTLFAGAVTMLLLALQLGGPGSTYPWKSSQIIGLFVGSGVVISLFVAWVLYMEDDALIPPRLFANRNAALIFSSSLFSNGPFQTVIYWLPIWFQAVQSVSPTTSGVRYLPTVLSDVLTSVIGAGMAQQLGIWNPFLIFGESMVCLGGGLLTTLHPGISSGYWIGYQIFGGIGYSLIINMAHLGTQASLPQDLVPIGATTLLFGISASCAVFLAVGQAVFQERLMNDLSQVVSEKVVKDVISVGATQVREVVSAQDLPVVLNAYSKAVTQVFYIPAAAPVISFILVLGCKWIWIKKPEAEKVEENTGGKEEV
ncbi:MFS general substrate transporter [Lindgomyces ingoldianus]|uniref:MFS general substrate transporter n=1 Tax=Lindgomyces ingoldianus TaxID=673940 RepID=A0ACB6RGD9_9PLEO|nr:MFS general substrate transporter [Lindgomyces ingoldianus]KAF2478181.1 MFS general substrate transporter [Lindgomyces ingoldianus]